MVWTDMKLLQLKIRTNSWIWLSEIINYFATSNTIQSFQDLGGSQCRFWQWCFPDYLSVSQPYCFYFLNLHPSFCTFFSVITSHNTYFRHLQPVYKYMHYNQPFLFTWHRSNIFFLLSLCMTETLFGCMMKTKQEKNFFCGGEWDKSVTA